MTRRGRTFLPTTLAPSTRPWIAASATRNFALNDPLCDYLAQEAERTGQTITPGPFVQYLMKSGQEFEHKVVGELGSRFGPDVVKQVVLKDGSLSAADDAQKLAWFRETLRLMREGVAIIYQGFLLDDEERIYGVPDLLVRSDFLRRLVSVNPLKEDEEKRGCAFAKNFHYVVVEIKWTTLLFCVDQLHLRNGGSTTAFKTQVALYHHCLEKVQQSGRQLAFILGKRSKSAAGPVTDDCFHRLGHLDFGGKDRSFFALAHTAVTWLQDLKTEGSSWVLYPRPSRKELYPNMKNHNDDPWRPQKEVIADKLQEITQIWYCKHTNRQTCFRKGIYSWSDPRCTIEAMGIKGQVIGPIIKRILDVNRDPDHWILPATLKQGPQENELMEDLVNVRPQSWLEHRKGDFYLDFEFISMLDNGLGHFPSANVNGLVYLIGTGYYDSSMTWRYRCFLANRLTHGEEQRIFQEWIAFIMNEAHNQGVTAPRLFHWGTAEDTWFGKHTDKFPASARKTLSFYFVNVLDEIKRYPIVIKGAFGFGLKEFGTALHKLGKVQSHWPEIDGGLDTITHIMSLQEQAVQKACAIPQCEGAAKLQTYNETDCRMVAEILDVLRDYYDQIEEEDEAPVRAPARRRRQVIPDSSEEDDIPLSELQRRKEQSAGQPVEVWEPTGDAGDEAPMMELLSGRKRRLRSDPLEDFIVPDDAEAEPTGEEGEGEEDESEADDEEEPFPELEELNQSGREWDHLRIAKVVAGLEAASANLNRFQREHVVEQLRVLNQTQEQTEEFFALLNYLLYYTQTHPSLDPSYYPEEHRAEVTALAQHQQERHLTFPDIMAAPLPLEQKSELYEQLLTLATLSPFSEGWFQLRNNIHRVVEDARALTPEQRVLLTLTVEDANYLTRIAESSFPNPTKAYLVAKYKKAMSASKDDSERATDLRILDYALSLPLGKRALPLSREQLSAQLLEGRRYLDRQVYGMVALKEQFLLQIIEELRGDDQTRGKIIGICGSPGIGKSTFANAVATASARPVYRINMGGISDIGMLIGNLPTWVGADIGLLSRALITGKREDIVIVLEEIDKISPTHYGEEITHLLAHVLDPAFNDQITDKFLGMSYSLRHVTFVATFNDAEAIPPVIRNRIRIFRLPDPSPSDKLQTCLNIVVPELYRSYKFSPEELTVTEEALQLLIRATLEDKGLRTLQNLLVSLFGKLYALRELDPTVGATLFRFYRQLTFPCVLTPQLVGHLLREELRNPRPDYLNSYS